MMLPNALLLQVHFKQERHGANANAHLFFSKMNVHVHYWFNYYKSQSYLIGIDIPNLFSSKTDKLKISISGHEKADFLGLDKGRLCLFDPQTLCCGDSKELSQFRFCFYKNCGQKS